jgi:hypothetical protein
MGTDEIKLDEQYLEFLNDLQKLSKSELVDLIHNYWVGLRTESERQMNDKENYLQEEFGRIKMTEVNRLKILANIKSKYK